MSTGEGKKMMKLEVVRMELGFALVECLTL